MEEQRLQVLIESQLPIHWWDYAIFWQASTDSLSLSWKHGHFQGPVTSHEADLISDAEWFYVASFTKSFILRDGGGIIGRAFRTGALVWLTGPTALRLYACDRPRQAHSHGLQTLVCIPAADGVVELGSTHLINESWTLVQQTQSLFSETNPEPESKPEPALSSNMTSGFLPEDILYNVETCKDDDVIPDWSREPKRKRWTKTDLARPQVHCHVEAERRRREKINTLFYELRSVVPKVSRMDKASLLSDAVSYINELRARVTDLEAQVKTGPAPALREVKVEVEVKLVGSHLASVRVESAADLAARVMEAMRQLELPVCHATISVINDVMLQDLVVRVPEELRNQTLLHNAIVATI